MTLGWDTTRHLIAAEEGFALERLLERLETRRRVADVAVLGFLEEVSADTRQSGRTKEEPTVRDATGANTVEDSSKPHQNKHKDVCPKNPHPAPSKFLKIYQAGKNQEPRSPERTMRMKQPRRPNHLGGTGELLHILRRPEGDCARMALVQTTTSITRVT